MDLFPAADNFFGLVPLFWRVLEIHSGFNARVVAIGTTLLGAASGVLGTFILLRKKALVSDALSHACLPGLVAAFLIGTLFNQTGKSLFFLLLGAACSSLLAVGAIQFLIRWSRLKDDAAIAVVLSVSFGCGVVLLSIAQSLPSGQQGGLSHFIYGQTAAMHFYDAVWLAILTGFSCVILALFAKELGLVAFDQDFAAVQGYPVSFLDVLLMAMTVLVTVIGLQAVGLILMIALLVIPAAAARFWTERLRSMVWISLGLGACSGYLGSMASALLPNFPAGSVIVLVSGVFFGVSFLFAPKRGWIAAKFQHLKMQIFVSQDHFLRDLFERLESLPDKKSFLAPTEKPDGGAIHRLAFALLKWQRHVIVGDAGFQLTDSGFQKAQRLTRNHRLWEAFLVHYADLAVSHVDRAADRVEHALSPEIISYLEAALAAKGQSLLAEHVPKSLHPVPQGKPNG